jgi:RNA polymerase sigma factor (sigma-70 family)
MQTMAIKRQQSILQAVSDYGRRLFAFIRSRVSTEEDAEDILQDVWYQLNIQEEIETIESISGWLFRVARNRITDKGRKKHEALLDDYGYTDEDGSLVLPAFMLAVGEGNPEDERQRTLFREMLFEALDELPENQRSVFERNELGDSTLQEIANEDGIPLKTAISRKRYAVLHLRKRLEEFYTDFLND